MWNFSLIDIIFLNQHPGCLKISVAAKKANDNSDEEIVVLFHEKQGALRLHILVKIIVLTIS